jgi:hypothetical protein
LDLRRLEANVQPVRRTLVKVSLRRPHLVDVLLMFARLQAPQSGICDEELTYDCPPQVVF